MIPPIATSSLVRRSDKVINLFEVTRQFFPLTYSATLKIDNFLDGEQQILQIVITDITIDSIITLSQDVFELLGNFCQPDAVHVDPSGGNWRGKHFPNMSDNFPQTHLAGVATCYASESLNQMEA